MAGYIGSKSSVTLVDGITKNGGTLEGDLSFGDNDKAIFGAGSDLQIYHDPSNGSIIKDNGTGRLILDSENGTGVSIMSGGIAKDMIDATKDGAVTLYHNGSSKLATTSTGVDVTGTVIADELSVSDAGKLGFNTTGSYTLNSVPSPDFGLGYTVSTNPMSLSGYYGIAFATNRTEAMRIDSSGNVGIGTSSPSALLHVAGDARIGAGTGDASLMGMVASGDNFKITTSSGIGTISFDRNVGIGTSSPSTKLTVLANSANGIDLAQDPDDVSNSGRLFFTTSGGSNSIRSTSGALQFSTGATAGTSSGSERMRIDSSGNVGIGCSPTYRLDVDSGGSVSAARLRRNTDGSLRTVLLFLSRSNSNTVGSISISNSATAYNTSSDYRLKENVVDLTGASARVNQLNPSRFNFIADADTTVDGFLAHEVATVVPEAITGTKDAMKDEEYEVTPATGDIYTPSTDAYVDDDGNDVDAVDEVIHSADAEQPETLEDGQQWRETTAAVMGTRSVPDYQGIDQSKLVPLLTAALQEALTEIASLKTRVEALEA